MRVPEFAYVHKRSKNVIASAAAATVVLILALAANAEQPERTFEERMAFIDQLTPSERRAHFDEMWANLPDFCANVANPEQCRAESEAGGEESFLIQMWLFGVLQPAETTAENEYRVPAITFLRSRLYEAGFRLCPAVRQAVKGRLDRLEEIRALDDTAAGAYLDKLLNGHASTIPAIPYSCSAPTIKPPVPDTRGSGS